MRPSALGDRAGLGPDTAEGSDLHRTGPLDTGEEAGAEGLCGVGRAPGAAPLVVGCVWRVSRDQGGSAPVPSCRGACGFASAMPSAPIGTGDAPVQERGRAGAGHRFARARRLPERPSPSARGSGLAACARTGPKAPVRRGPRAGDGGAAYRLEEKRAVLAPPWGPLDLSEEPGRELVRRRECGPGRGRSSATRVHTRRQRVETRHSRAREQKARASRRGPGTA